MVITAKMIAEAKAVRDQWRAEEVQNAKWALEHRAKKLYQAEANNWDVAAARAQQIYQAATAGDQKLMNAAGFWKNETVIGTDPLLFKNAGVRAGIYQDFAFAARTRPERGGDVNPVVPPQRPPPKFADGWGVPTAPSAPDIGGAPELPSEKTGWTWPERIGAVVVVVAVVWGLNRWRS